MPDKFKAWDPYYEEFLKVKAIIYDPKTLLHNGDELFEDGYIIDEHNDCHLFKDIKLLEYTGKNDIHDEPLYEGDYVYREHEKEVYEIRYNNEKTAFIAYPINKKSCAAIILLCRTDKWIKIGNKFEGLDKEYEKKCDYCDNEALYKYEKSKVCKDHLLLKLLSDGNLVEVYKTIYQDKNGKYVGSDESGDLLYDDLVKHFHIKRIDEDEE